MPLDFKDDIASVGRIDAVPTILDVVCRTTGMGFAAIARVTEDRWVACRVLDNIDFGLEPGGELPVETTICNEIRTHREPVLIADVAEDAHYSSHRTPAQYGFRSYVSVPITLPDGTFFGTLCAIDPRPHDFDDPQVLGMFTLFADLIAQHLDSNRKLTESEDQLSMAQETGVMREQFIAVLGHDLRSPLASIGGGARLLSRANLDDRSQNIVALIQSTVVRMTGLVDNMLDFARGRLGDGLSLEVRNDCDFGNVLVQIIEELRSGTDREILTDIEIDRPVPCDEGRLGQLFSNLLANALTHGAADEPIRVEARVVDDVLRLSVANGGEPIPPEARRMLFQPFQRGEVRSSMNGLGLGLYIASEIAKAHGGTIEAASDRRETRFTFRLPLTREAQDAIAG